MSKRVFQLRKKLDAGSSAAGQQATAVSAPIKQYAAVENKSHMSSLTAKPQPEQDNLSQRIEDQQESPNSLSLGPKLIMNRSYIHFEKLVGRVDLKQVDISNVGSSAIYYEWVKLPRSRINSNAIYDEAPKFFCHHDKNVIRPGESINFVFSFLSHLPGIFIEEYEFKCQPAPTIPLPTLKLEGKAIIIDEFEAARKDHSTNLTREFLEKSVREILSDLIDSVKSPEQPRPDMNDAKTAAKQFERLNENYGVYHNDLVFSWWKGLYSETADKLNIPADERYWSGSINELKHLIGGLPDEVDRICFNERLDNYLHWSRRKRPDQSPLFGSVRDLLCKLVLNIAGDINDTVRRQLDMWEIPWREPIDPPNEAEKKARDEQIAKIKAEWLKKAKKKKWGEEQEKALVGDYRSKVETKSKEALLNYFEQLDHAADYTRTDTLAQKPPLSRNYFRWLERLKTVKQAEVEGRKVLLKVQLKLRPGGESRLPELHEFLVKRKEYEKKLEQQRKEQEGKDKKKSKKTAKKKEQELVAPEFDMMSVLEEQSCKDIIEAIKSLQERSLKILIVACSYGPKRGIELPNFRLEFFWDYVRQLTDPTMVFIQHNQLAELGDRIQNDFYPEGSILMLENINFLPSEALSTETDGKVVRPLMEEVNYGVHLFERTVDVFVNDNKVQKQSGLSLYLHKENVLGLSWWRQIGVALKAENSDMIVAGRLTPEKLCMLEASIWYAKRVFLVGEIGVKFALVQSSQPQALNLKVSTPQHRAITTVLKRIVMEWEPNIPKHKKSPEPHRAQFIYPKDILAGAPEGNWQAITSNSHNISLTQEKLGEADKSAVVLDVGQQTVSQLLEYVDSSKHVFLIDQLPVDARSMFSTQQLFKHFFKLREARKARHQEQQKKGINYRLDTVITLVGDFDAVAQKVQLKEKVQKQEESDQPEQEKPEQEGEPIRNLSLLQDFTLPDSSYTLRLLTGEYVPSLSNIDKYAKSDD